MKRVNEINESNNKGLLLYFAYLLIGIAIGLCVGHAFKKSPYMLVTGSSMEPTIRNGTFIRYQRIDLDKEVTKDSIIIFNNGKHKNIKRVIASPGDTVKIIKNQNNYEVVVNDQSLFNLAEDDIGEYMSKALINDSVVLKENQYVVCGDNHENSYDSLDYGPITTEQIIGVYKSDIL